MSSDANNLNPDSERLCLCELLFVHIREKFFFRILFSKGTQRPHAFYLWV